MRTEANPRSDAAARWGVLVALLCAPGRAGAEGGADSEPPVVEHHACDQYQRGRPIPIQARITDASPLYDPKVLYRFSARGTWQRVPLTPKGRSEIYEAEIPAPEGDAELSYLIEVVDENGNGPTRVGDLTRPLVRRPAAAAAACKQVLELVDSSSATGAATALGAQPEAAPPRCQGANRPLYCEVWLWATVGAAVAAGTGVGLYFLLRDNEPRPTGVVVLEIGTPSPVPQAMRGGR